MEVESNISKAARLIDDAMRMTAHILREIEKINHPSLDDSKYRTAESGIVKTLEESPDSSAEKPSA